VPFTSGLCVRIERGLTVECPKCGRVGFLSSKALSRAAVAPGTPIAAFVKRLRCRRCGNQSVLGGRKSVLLDGRKHGLLVGRICLFGGARKAHKLRTLTAHEIMRIAVELEEKREKAWHLGRSNALAAE
jgi:ribosomal protein S27AE